ALYVEAEAAGRVAARARLLRRGEELADRREQPGIRGGVRARRAADRALADVDHAIDVLETFDVGERCRVVAGLVDVLGGRLVQRVVDERALARARYAGHAGQKTDRKRRVHAL